MATVFKLAEAQSKAGVSREKDQGSDNDDETKEKYKQCVLALSSRGINYRQRHLLSDLGAFFLISKKNQKSRLGILNELAELNNRNSRVFFEARRRQDRTCG